MAGATNPGLLLMVIDQEVIAHMVCTLSTEEIEERTGLSLPQYHRAVRQLEARGLVVREVKRLSGGGSRLTMWTTLPAPWSSTGRAR